MSANVLEAWTIPSILTDTSIKNDTTVMMIMISISNLTDTCTVSVISPKANTLRLFHRLEAWSSASTVKMILHITSRHSSSFHLRPRGIKNRGVSSRSSPARFHLVAVYGFILTSLHTVPLYSSASC